MPMVKDVGDIIGLYPITYLDRYLLEKNPTDLEIAKTTVEKYIIPWPQRLPDNTFSRIMCWANQPEKGECVWADDMYVTLFLTILSIFFKVYGNGFAFETCCCFEQ